MTAGYDAVLLAGFGGPERSEDVLPFLENVTRGRGIPRERLVEVAHHYDALGGRSPINEQTAALRAALERELRGRGIELPVLWGNRNWAPYFADTVTTAAAAGHSRLLAVTTSAYSSYSSCRQYREDFAAALDATGLLDTVRIDKVRAYFDQPGFLTAVADPAVTAVRTFVEEGFSLADCAIVFTTHSIPQTMAETSGSAVWGDHLGGGAYVAQHLAAAAEVAGQVAAQVGPVAWQLAFQSRSGPPQMPWLEPDVNDVLVELAGSGVRALVVVPIGFVSDHVEVVWDLDNEAAETAAAQGLRFLRSATAGTDPRFVAALADLVAERLGGFSAAPSPTGLPARPDFCAPGCCVNLRGVKPTTAGQDSDRDRQAAGAAR